MTVHQGRGDRPVTLGGGPGHSRSREGTGRSILEVAQMTILGGGIGQSP